MVNYGPSVVSAVGAFLSAGGAFWKSEHDMRVRPIGESKTFRTPALLVFLGALLVVGGTLWSAQNQVRSSLQQQQLQSKLVQKSEEIVAITNQLAGKSDQISRLNEVLSSKSDEIARLSKQVEFSVTGRGFCYVVPSMTEDQRSFRPVIVNDGEYPLYDIHLRIGNLEAFAELLKKSHGKLFEEDLAKTGLDLPIGNLSPHTTITVNSFMLLPDSGEARFNVFFLSRSGSITELLRMRRVSGRWVSAIRVLASNGRTVLLERIDPKFLTDRQDRVNWE